MYDSLRRFQIASTIAAAAGVDIAHVVITVTSASVLINADIHTNSTSQSLQVATILRPNIAPLLASVDVTVTDVPLIEVLEGAVIEEIIIADNTSQSLPTQNTMPRSTDDGDGAMATTATCLVFLVAIGTYAMIRRSRKNANTLKRLDEVWLEPDPNCKGDPRLLLHVEATSSVDDVKSTGEMLGGTNGDETETARAAMLEGDHRSEDATVVFAECSTPNAEDSSPQPEGTELTVTTIAGGGSADEKTEVS